MKPGCLPELRAIKHSALSDNRFHFADVAYRFERIGVDYYQVCSLAHFYRTHVPVKFHHASRHYRRRPDSFHWSEACTYSSSISRCTLCPAPIHPCPPPLVIRRNEERQPPPKKPTLRFESDCPGRAASRRCSNAQHTAWEAPQSQARTYQSMCP